LLRTGPLEIERKNLKIKHTKNYIKVLSNFENKFSSEEYEISTSIKLVNYNFVELLKSYKIYYRFIENYFSTFPFSSHVDHNSLKDIELFTASSFILIPIIIKKKIWKEFDKKRLNCEFEQIISKMKTKNKFNSNSEKINSEYYFHVHNSINENICKYSTTPPFKYSVSSLHFPISESFIPSFPSFEPIKNSILVLAQNINCLEMVSKRMRELESIEEENNILNNFELRFSFYLKNLSECMNNNNLNSMEIKNNNSNSSSSSFIETSNIISIPLKCPISKHLLNVPCRGSYNISPQQFLQQLKASSTSFCTHFQCFDYFSFTPYTPGSVGKCPICEKRIFLSNLKIDMLILYLLNERHKYLKRLGRKNQKIRKSKSDFIDSNSSTPFNQNRNNNFDNGNDFIKVDEKKNYSLKVLVYLKNKEECLKYLRGKSRSNSNVRNNFSIFNSFDPSSYFKFDFSFEDDEYFSKMDLNVDIKHEPNNLLVDLDNDIKENKILKENKIIRSGRLENEIYSNIKAGFNRKRKRIQFDDYLYSDRYVYDYNKYYHNEKDYFIKNKNRDSMVGTNSKLRLNKNNAKFKLPDISSNSVNNKSKSINYIEEYHKYNATYDNDDNNNNNVQQESNNISTIFGRRFNWENLEERGKYSVLNLVLGFYISLVKNGKITSYEWFSLIQTDEYPPLNKIFLAYLRDEELVNGDEYIMVLNIINV
jgi:hypothetical protein